MNTALKWIGGGLAVVMLVAALYVGSYYATVEKRIASSFTSSFLLPADPADWCEPGYRFGGETFFAPMHRVDRRLRREYWGEPPIIWDKHP